MFLSGVSIKKDIRNNFGQAASRYTRYGSVQEAVAHILFECVSKRVKSEQVGSVLEIGCGTGFLSQHTTNYFNKARHVITDMSSYMVEHCRAKFSQERCHYVVCDGESLPFTGDFDLVVSTMVFQWFENFKQSVEELFKRTNMLAFSIPIEGSFRAWNDAHKVLGIKNRTMDFYSLSRLKEMLTSMNPKKVSVETIDLGYEVQSTIDFLRYLRKLGAHTRVSEDRYKVLELRKLFKIIDESNSKDIANYKIAICILER